MSRNAIISVSDKTDIVFMAEFLQTKGFTIYSSGGTYKLLSQHVECCQEISDYTGFPEILNGRVKTLHPKIYGGILSHRNIEDQLEAQDHGILKFELVIVNLYPFKQVTCDPNKTRSEAISNIDIGGHTLLRAGIKNYHNVTILVNPIDYKLFTYEFDEIDKNYHSRSSFNEIMMKNALRYVTQYDIDMLEYFDTKKIKIYESMGNLKYGLNPHQMQAAIYKNPSLPSPFQILNGRVGYINVLDAVNSWGLVKELSGTLKTVCAASFKHTSPAGVGISNPLSEELLKTYFINPDLNLTAGAIAYLRARNADPLSSYGDFIALSNRVDETTAMLIKKETSDGIIAPGFTVKALEILKNKKKGAFVILQANPLFENNNIEFRDVQGVTLTQEPNKAIIDDDTFKGIVTRNKNLTELARMNLTIANISLKYAQSNNVAFAFDGQLVGLAAGQQNRVDCVKLAGQKTKKWFLRQHPLSLRLLSRFKLGIKKQDKINAISQYIENDFTNIEWKHWISLFNKYESDDIDNINDEIPILSREIQKEFLETKSEVCMASDAFFPFRDSIDKSSQCGTNYIIQPGGSIADEGVIQACNEYNMTMIFSNQRLFYH